jgi:uncharacterized protein (DUF1697 family)
MRAQHSRKPEGALVYFFGHSIHRRAGALPAARWRCYSDQVPTYVALLRAINVGGTGKLAMTDLRALCEGCGFTDVATYIQSGNVVFRSKLGIAAAKKALEAALAKKMGKPYGVLLRTAAELAQIAAEPPFPKAPPNFLLIVFFDEPIPAKSLDGTPAPDGEEWEVRGREVFIHYAGGSGKSKLKLPLPKNGTSRNLNTVRKLAEMSAALK